MLLRLVLVLLVVVGLAAAAIVFYEGLGSVGPAYDPVTAWIGLGLASLAVLTLIVGTAWALRARHRARRRE
jgi:hypothetical protein